ncbi:hypothetical protein [Micromonospora sp. NPDC093277]|uniref:hypothetical protein n=1 Tax=Micromonospora sp. NPDC093277 TaxID=3364291 RepID=UPI00382070D4
MTPHDAEMPSTPGTGPAPLDAAAALGEIHRVTRRVRVGRRWEALEYVASAALFPTYILLLHLHPRHSNWILAFAVALVLAGAVLHWRAGVISWGSTRRGKLVWWCQLPLLIAASFALEWVPPGLSPWLMIVALVPGLPALVGAAWVLRR